jgi:hypothetical protein
MTNANGLKQRYVAGSLDQRSQDVGEPPTPSALQELLFERFGPATLSILLPSLGTASSYLCLAEAGHLLSAVGVGHTVVAAAYLEACRWGVYDRCQFTAVKEGEPLPYFPAEFDVIVLTERHASNFPIPHKLVHLLKEGGLLVRSDDELKFVIEE